MNARRHMIPVRDMATGSSSKMIFSFVKRKKCDSSGVAPSPHPRQKGRSQLCRCHFKSRDLKSVFTQEDDSPLPDLGESKHPDAPPINVSEDGVFKLLQGLNPSKATGPDCLSSRLLKEMATPLTPAAWFLENIIQK